MNVLCIGDVVGRPGRRAWSELAAGLISRHRAEFVIVNGENSAAGFGITPEICDELLRAGAHCITGGNHSWKQRSIYAYIEEEPRLLRPANFPGTPPGRGAHVYATPGGMVGVINLLGLAGLEPMECPFRTFDALWEDLRDGVDLLIVDFHAESTAEKAAFAWHVDGRAALVFGTHTHVQTADERILPGGTGFITDIGMTGPEESVIGVAKEKVLEKFLTRMPVRFEVPDGEPLLCGIVAELDPATGRCRAVRRIQERIPAARRL